MVCPVCLQPYGNGDVITFQCGHLFHESCIQTYREALAQGGSIAVSLSCPECRRSVKYQHQVFLNLGSEDYEHFSNAENQGQIVQASAGAHEEQPKDISVDLDNINKHHVINEDHNAEGMNENPFAGADGSEAFAQIEENNAQIDIENFELFPNEHTDETMNEEPYIHLSVPMVLAFFFAIFIYFALLPVFFLVFKPNKSA